MASEPKRVGPPEDFNPEVKPVMREEFEEVWEESIPVEESIARRRRKSGDG